MENFPSKSASLLVAQRSERWCTSLGAQGSIPGMSRSESAITLYYCITVFCVALLSDVKGFPNNDAATYLIFVNYILWNFP